MQRRLQGRTVAAPEGHRRGRDLPEGAISPISELARRVCLRLRCWCARLRGARARDAGTVQPPERRGRARLARVRVRVRGMVRVRLSSLLNEVEEKHR